MGLNEGTVGLASTGFNRRFATARRNALPQARFTNAECHMTKLNLPTFEDLLWPTLGILKSRGGSATIRELSEDVSGQLDLPDDILNMQHGSGPRSEIDYRAAWARTHLKRVGAVENTSRGVWTITETGRAVQEREIRERVRQARAERHRTSRQRDANKATGDESASEERDWRDALLKIIRGIPPEAFERLCQRVLRQAGFIKVEVAGRSGDGGIDGAGVLRVNLLSFHVRFQCKRYAGAVGSREIRDFRGAMVGRADKGLFLTTGGFTKDAQREAVRDGTPAIDLIDGTDLCDLLKYHKLGVTTETIEVVSPKPDFFENL